MSAFNTESRTSNAIKISVIGGISNITKFILGFGYRTLFLCVLSEVYLGINGLFTNILQVLSLAELGVSTAIVYRFYEPISLGDVHYVGMLMNFFGKMYRYIALAILMLGILIMPFLKYLINSSDTIPSDVNLYVVYILFLLNTIASYIFSYKLTLLTADQKNYAFSLFDLFSTVIKYGMQIIVLYITLNYTVTLAIGIATTIIVNYVGSKWTEKQYKEVFEVEEMLPKEEQKNIFTDTKACMYHKVGTTVLNGTDNAVLTKMVGLAATGIYSNYSLIMYNLQQLITQLLGNFTAPVGNALRNMSNDDYYKLFKKINFSGMWVASVVTVGLYISIDDFISLWLGERFAFNKLTNIILCIQFYLTITRVTNGAFINAAGLFVKDKIRPLIEALLNLVISIILTRYLGIAGVFLGTIISALATVQWRDPYILYVYSFKRNVWDYWSNFAIFTVFTILICIALSLLKDNVLSIRLTWWVLMVEAVCSIILVNAVLYLVFRNTDEFIFLKNMVKKILAKFSGIFKHTH